MGTMIHLYLGNLTLDWGQNNSYVDHSVLFQLEDLTHVPTYYAKDDSQHSSDNGIGDEDFITEYQIGLSKPLWQVIERLNLLGYSVEYFKKEFEYLEEFHQATMEDNNLHASFAELSQALATMDVSMISLVSGKYDFKGEKFKYELYDRMGRSQFIKQNPYIIENIGQGYDLLSSYAILRLIASNPKARDLPVIWDFADHESAGWGNRNDYVKLPDQKDRFLIVTEGSSDAQIIKHALYLLKPHLADLFDFIDMEEGYPFTGTGNMVNFLKGLISIKVMNNVIAIFDNDAEGVYNYQKCHLLNIPNNIKILKLPDNNEFKNFRTIGPDGNALSNINGRAAAIECYLELDEKSIVRWNIFNSHLNIYHGELIGKDQYKKKFLAQKSKRNNYNYKNILSILELIFSHCTELKEQSLLAKLKLNN